MPSARLITSQQAPNMKHFPSKKFQGKLYTFEHLSPSKHLIALDAKRQQHIKLRVTYSIHCFTEEFDSALHIDHHRYTFANETRAFNPTRYECSLLLPKIIGSLERARVYRAMQKNYTYVANISIDGSSQPYSLFFTLLKEARELPEIKMYVQSAYLKPLTVGPNAQSWRFGSLLGQVAGVFEPQIKKVRPKKKAP